MFVRDCNESIPQGTRCDRQAEQRSASSRGGSCHGVVCKKQIAWRFFFQQCIPGHFWAAKLQRVVVVRASDLEVREKPRSEEIDGDEFKTEYVVNV